MYQDILEKASRLKKPRMVSVTLRPELRQWLEELSSDLHCSVSHLILGFLEDAYDKADKEDLFE